MARQRMVTRTVEVNTASVMTLNTETAEVRIIDYKLGALPNNVDVLKILKKMYETDTIKLCAIKEFSTETVLYGMPEEQFIQLARVLPPRTNADSENE